MTWDLIWILTMGNNGAVGGNLECRRSSCSSFQAITSLHFCCFQILYFKGISCRHVPYLKCADVLIYTVSTAFVFHCVSHNDVDSDWASFQWLSVTLWYLQDDIFILKSPPPPHPWVLHHYCTGTRTIFFFIKKSSSSSGAIVMENPGGRGVSI